MSRLVALLALVIAVLSLALNVVLITRLDRARLGALQALDRTDQRLGSLGDVSIQRTFAIRESFSTSGTIPFKQDMLVPISTTVPISSSMDVDVDTLLGKMTVPVSYNANVPVNMQMPVHVEQTVPYSLTVPVNLDIPFELHLSELGVQSAVDEARQELRQLRAALE